MLFQNNSKSLISKILLLMSLSFLSACCILFFNKNNHHSLSNFLIREYSPDSDFNSQILLVDVRPFADYDRAHIPGALSLDPHYWDKTYPAFLENWSPERQVIIYCGGKTCGLSKMIALKLLKDLPYANIAVLKGGFPAWEASNNKAKLS